MMEGASFDILEPDDERVSIFEGKKVEELLITEKVRDSVGEVEGEFVSVAVEVVRAWAIVKMTASVMVLRT